MGISLSEECRGSLDPHGHEGLEVTEDGVGEGLMTLDGLQGGAGASREVRHVV